MVFIGSMKKYLKKLLSQPLSEHETAQVFSLLLEDTDNAASDAQIGAYLLATSLRGPSAAELIAGVRSLREHMVRVPLRMALSKDAVLLDTAGTGGSGLDSFNTSTVAALVIAASGQTVTKHGNRAASSKCGSADLLEALGVTIELSPEQASRCAVETGFCFMFAPLHHPATKRVARVRRELGFRTLFNFLGPLCNPAGAECQLMGVSEKTMLPVISEALLELGCQRAMIVRGEDGLDELSLSTDTEVFEVNQGFIRHYHIAPEDFGLERVALEQIKGYEPARSAELALEVLRGKVSPYRDLIALNAGAGLYVANKVADIAEGVAKANEVLSSGKAAGLLEKVKEVSRRYGAN